MMISELISSFGDQVDLKPVNAKLVFSSADLFKEIIDTDDLEEGAPIIQERWELLTNDEKMRVCSLLSGRPSGSRRMYSNILTIYTSYIPE